MEYSLIDELLSFACAAVIVAAVAFVWLVLVSM